MQESNKKKMDRFRNVSEECCFKYTSHQLEIALNRKPSSKGIGRVTHATLSLSTYSRNKIHKYSEHQDAGNSY